MSVQQMFARILNLLRGAVIRIKKSVTSSPFSCLDIFLLFVSTVSFIADIGTDVIVIIQYYLKEHYMWMILTMSLVCIPSLLIQIFSLRWYIMDNNCSNFIWAAHIVQLGVFNRYVELFKIGLRVRKSKSPVELSRFNQQQSDICMLRLFESFMESAPQLVLQLYIMASMEDWSIWTGVSAIASVFSLSWGIAAYSKTMRNVRPEKKHLSWCGLIFQALWRIGTVSARIISLVAFAVAYGPILLLVMFFHWLFMTVWVITQNTDFCTTWWEERLYNCIVGTMYCFCFFNLKDGRSRWRMASFYSVTSFQNIGFVLAHYFSSGAKHGEKEIAVALVFAGILIGLTSMLLYYRFFHPSGPIKLWGENNFSKVLKKEDSKINIGNCSTLKTARKPNPSLGSQEFSLKSGRECSDDGVLLNADRNASILSTRSNLGCQSDLHRSHSLNCSSHEFDVESDFAHGHYRRRPLPTFQANHHRNVNYNFRSAVAFGQQMPAFHCSCLILMNDNFYHRGLYDSIYTIQSSLSLPNLKSMEPRIKLSPVLHLSSSTEDTGLKKYSLSCIEDTSSEKCHLSLIGDTSSEKCHLSCTEDTSSEKCHLSLGEDTSSEMCYTSSREISIENDVLSQDNDTIEDETNGVLIRQSRNSEHLSSTPDFDDVVVSVHSTSDGLDCTPTIFSQHVMKVSVEY